MVAENSNFKTKMSKEKPFLEIFEQKSCFEPKYLKTSLASYPKCLNKVETKMPKEKTFFENKMFEQRLSTKLTYAIFLLRS